MAATIARAQGFTKHGTPKAGEATRLGGGYAVAEANTWQTFAKVRTDADGVVDVEIRRNGGRLFSLVLTEEKRDAAYITIRVPVNVNLVCERG